MNEVLKSKFALAINSGPSRVDWEQKINICCVPTKCQALCWACGRYLAQASLTRPLTKQVLQYGLVLVPETIECVPARTPDRQGVPPNPASAGELVKVLTGAHSTVKRLQDFSSHSNAGLCEAGAVGCVCGRGHG